MAAFDLNSELLRLHEDGESFYVRNETPVLELTAGDHRARLAEVIDAMEGNAFVVLDEEMFDMLRSFVKYGPKRQPGRVHDGYR